MVNDNKSNILAAVAGVVVGAGAAIAGAVALSDKGNQKVIDETLSTGKKKAEKLIQVVKTAQKGVKNI